MSLCVGGGGGGGQEGRGLITGHCHRVPDVLRDHALLGVVKTKCGKQRYNTGVGWAGGGGGGGGGGVGRN